MWPKVFVKSCPASRNCGLYFQRRVSIPVIGNHVNLMSGNRAFPELVLPIHKIPQTV
jgi:hypothetical protein